MLEATSGRMHLRFVSGRPVSQVTTDFLEAALRAVCLLGLAMRPDGKFRHHIQPFFLLTSSSLEPIYSFVTERNAISRPLRVNAC